MRNVLKTVKISKFITTVKQIDEQSISAQMCCKVFIFLFLLNGLKMQIITKFSIEMGKAI